MRADFSGYATRHNVLCSDGLTISPEAFKHNDKKKVPLVWQHMHNEPVNVLGHAILEYRPDGVYTYGFFNDTDLGKTAKALVAHRDINALSIYANRLQKQNMYVMHGEIREVSLVMAGANPGALIDSITIQHSDGETKELEDEAIIHTGLTFEHVSDFEVALEDPDVSHADEDKGDSMPEDQKTLADVVGTMNEEQKAALYFMVGEAAASDSVEQSDKDDEDSTISSDDTDSDSEEVEQSSDDKEESAEDTSGDEDSDENDKMQHDQEGNSMSRNLFDQDEETQNKSGTPAERVYLSHSDMEGILQDAVKLGSAKTAVEKYALAHGIQDIDTLFPDAKAVSQTPEFQKRRTEWVAKVMDGVKATPFARIKSLMADLTVEEARAKGYITSALKTEEFFRVSKRVTLPQTIYKKQKLERDDVVDITDFDVVAWVKGEMRIMLEEEIARAILIGDGRSIADPDKIYEDNIRPILTDHQLYTTTVHVNIDDASSTPDEIVDAIILNRKHYRGSGRPDFFCSETILAKLLTAKDTLGRRLYKDVTEVAAALRVSSIVEVEAFEAVPDLVGIMVDLRDYTVGTNAGGQVTMFDDFDIDYNQMKYLLESRASGALVKWKAALAIMKTAASDTLVAPETPTIAANVITIPTVTGVTYTAKEPDGTAVVPVAGEITLTTPALERVIVTATADSGYYFENNSDTEWTFYYSA